MEPGPAGGATASYTAGPRYSDGGDLGDLPFLYGPVGVNLAYGWAGPRPDRPAVRAGVHVPVPFAVLAQPDLYVQAPPAWTGPLAAGAGLTGVLAERGRVVMPYLQLGRIAPGGSGWYTTQGYYRNDRNREVRERPIRASEAWVPTLAYQFGAARTTTHLFVTGVLGRVRERCDAFSDRVCEQGRWGLHAGATLEWHRRRRAGR